MYVDEEGLFPDFFDSSVGETAEFTGTLSVSTSAGVSALLQDRMTGAVSTVQPILRDLERTAYWYKPRILRWCICICRMGTDSRCYRLPCGS